MACVLYPILARSADRAVILRRGPTNQVLLLTWELRTDVVTEGQWLKGRIYEQHCDLSPDGEHFLYLAAKYGRFPREETWTVVSRPPYLTALAIWLHGGAYLGGGLFADDDRILLRDVPDHGQPPRFSGRKWRTGSLDGDPYWTRLRRDGWSVTLQPEDSLDRKGFAVTVRSRPPHTVTKSSPLDAQLVLKVTHTSPYWPSPLQRPLPHELMCDGVPLALPEVDWADWDRNGDLLFSRGGELRRLPAADLRAGDVGRVKLIADLTPLRFRSRITPPDYCT